MFYRALAGALAWVEINRDEQELFLKTAKLYMPITGRYKGFDSEQSRNAFLQRIADLERTNSFNEDTINRQPNTSSLENTDHYPMLSSRIENIEKSLAADAELANECIIL